MTRQQEPNYQIQPVFRAALLEKQAMKSLKHLMHGLHFNWITHEAVLEMPSLQTCLSALEN